MKKLFTIAALAGTLVLTGCGPKESNIERHAEINAPRNLVFQNFAGFQNWSKWSPWYGLDPNCKYEYYGTPAQVGHGYTWNSENKEVGSGEMKITEMAPNDHIAFDLNFKSPWEAHSTGTMSVAEENGKSVVTWTMHQEHAGFARIMMMFMDMEKMIGGDFEKGLAKMKEVDEAEAKAAMEAQMAAPSDTSAAAVNNNTKKEE
ncbi:MAG: SRPBCC family protein [Chitinophagales bacterium]